MLGSIQTVTTVAEDLDVIEQVYGDHLKYSRVSRETVSDDLAASWGCPETTGREMLVLRPLSGKDSFLRFVQGDAVPEFKTLRSYGWSSTEIVCENVYELAEKLADSPFEVYQPPAVLGFDFTDAIHAFQVIGPAKELLYFTHIDEPVPGLDLPIAEAYIDKTFVTICGGPSLDALEDFYKDIFGLDHDPRMDGNIRVINKAYERPTGTKTTICTVPLPNQNLIELDQFPENAITRPRHKGCLPPGMAMVTFHHDNLDEVKVGFITPPQIRHEAPYNGARVASLIGAAGELIELIENQ
jgi:hypothetical protein